MYMYMYVHVYIYLYVYIYTHSHKPLNAFNPDTLEREPLNTSTLNLGILTPESQNPKTQVSWAASCMSRGCDHSAFSPEFAV